MLLPRNAAAMNITRLTVTKKQFLPEIFARFSESGSSSGGWPKIFIQS